MCLRFVVLSLLIWFANCYFGCWFLLPLFVALLINTLISWLVIFRHSYCCWGLLDLPLCTVVVVWLLFCVLGWFGCYDLKKFVVIAACVVQVLVVIWFAYYGLLFWLLDLLFIMVSNCHLMCYLLFGVWYFGVVLLWFYCLVLLVFVLGVWVGVFGCWAWLSICVCVWLLFLCT